MRPYTHLTEQIFSYCNESSSWMRSKTYFYASSLFSFSLHTHIPNIIIQIEISQWPKVVQSLLSLCMKCFCTLSLTNKCNKINWTAVIMCWPLSTQVTYAFSVDTLLLLLLLSCLCTWPLESQYILDFAHLAKCNHILGTCQMHLEYNIGFGVNNCQ